MARSKDVCACVIAHIPFLSYYFNTGPSSLQYRRSPASYSNTAWGVQYHPKERQYLEKFFFLYLNGHHSVGIRMEGKNEHDERLGKKLDPSF